MACVGFPSACHRSSFSPLVVPCGGRVRRWFLSGGAFGFAVGACVEGLAVCGGVIAPPLVVIASTQARADRQPLHKGRGRPSTPPQRQGQTVNPSTKAGADRQPLHKGTGTAGSRLSHGGTDQSNLRPKRTCSSLELAADLSLQPNRTRSPTDLAAQSSSSAHGGFAPARETVTSDTLEA